MASAELARRVHDRLTLAGVGLSSGSVDRLLAYFDVLALWNRRINLTAFDLSTPGDEAIDRLLVEPVAAARLVRADDRRLMDIGSGGGSPAVPLTIALPSIVMTMVEVRERKAAFLREVVRTLSLAAVVEGVRVEDLAASGRAGLFDVVTVRAVRTDEGLWQAIDGLLAPRGRLLWFGGLGHKTELSMVESGSVGSTAAFERESTHGL